MRKALLFLFAATGFVLSAYSQPDNAFAKATAKELVMTNQAKIGIPAPELQNADLSATYRVQAGDYTMVYLQQTYMNVPVFTKMLVLAFRNGQLLSKAGYFVENMQSLTGGSSATPAVSVNRAVELALAEEKIFNKAIGQPALSADGRIYDYGKLAGGSENTTAELMWFPIEKEKIESIKLVWQVLVSPPGTDDVWQVRIDAATGAVIGKYNILVEDHFGPANQQNVVNSKYVRRTTEKKLNNQWINRQSNTDRPFVENSVNYNVIPYPGEAPSFTPATVVSNPWSNAPGNATTLRWHSDGIDYNISRGNNVWATEDTLAVNQNTGTPATSSTALPNLNFITVPNYNVEPSRDAVMQQFCITNLFYWNNIIHDLTYQYGFDEVSGNFQANNQGRGGAGNDHVMALAQSGAAGHIGNNANFLTPTDGGRGRMRMYLFNAVGTTTLHVNTPPPIVGDYVALEGTFSANNLLGNVGPVTGQVVYFNDAAGGTHEACTGAPSNSLTGKIALINRGNCNFTVKVAAAQAAGAIAVIMVNNVAGAPIVMGGTDNTITIPAVMISQSDGVIFAAQLANNLNVTLSGSIPQPRDGDLDNGVISHEFGHGVSNRFTGGPANASCLQNAEQGGEGWSDYIGLMFTTNWATATVNDGALGRGVGTYVVGQPTSGNGIRNYKYSTTLAINPLTYADMGTGIIGTEVHNIGEIWCVALWEMTWGIIQQENNINPNFFNFSLAGNGGNSIAFKLVLEGMRLQPCSPGYIDARNAILQADRNLYGGRHQCAIWTAFAKRGMGYSASQGSSFSATDQTAATDLPPAPSITGQPANTTVPAGSNANFSVTVTPPTNSNAVLYYNWQVSTDNGITWTDLVPAVTTNTLTLTAVTAGMNGNRYRCQVTLGCNTTNSTGGILTVSVPSGFTFNSTTPATATCPAPATMSVTLGTTAAGGFSNPITLSAISGVPGGTTITFGTNPLTPGNSSTVVLNNANTLGAGTYNVTIQGTASGATTQTATVTYTINPGTGPAITAQPTNQTACAGNNATFTITSAAATSFQWQVSTDGGATWTNVGGATTATLTLTGVTVAMNGNQYRCIASALCGSTNSNAATLTVNTGAAITAQPSGATICTGQNTNLCVTATGSNLTYQWQSATSCAGPWTNIAGATTNCYLASPVSNTSYQCIVNSTSCPGAVTSNCATVTVATAVGISVSPANQTVCEGATATFSVTASGSGLTYQWQLSTDGGGTYSNIAGATNSSYTTAATTASMNGYRYRCVVSNGVCTPGTSGAAILTVNTLPAVSAAPQSATLCVGGSNTFSVTASGTAITYQWQISTDGGATWTNIAGATTSSYTVSAVTTGMNGNRYRCVVSGTCNPAVNSAAAILTVNTPVAITAQPSTQSVCATGTISFSVTATGTSPAYQWQESTNGGTSWTAITNGGVYSGATTNTLTLTNITAGMNGNQYRCVVSGSAPCGSANSSAATLNVTPQPVITVAPYTALLPGQVTTLTVNVAPAAGITITWQISTDGGTTWTTIAGATGSSVNADITKLGRYRVIVTNSSGSCLSQVVNITYSISNHLFIFPSPNDGQFQVAYYNEGGASSQRRIVIMNSMGQQVYDRLFSISGPYTLMSIDMRRAATGIYYVIIGDAQGKKLAEGKVHIH